MSQRERLYPEIKRLREDENLKWREIGERLGIHFKTAHDYYADPTGVRHLARHRKWQAKDFSDCPSCGDPMTGSTARRNTDGTCRDCWTKRVARQHREKVERAAQLYNAGASQRQVAAALGYGPNSIPPELTEARKLGLTGYRNRGYAQVAS
jgi:hypothetical protein